MTAKVTAVEFKSDLTGKVASDKVSSFTYNGATVELHLTDAEHAKLDETLSKYVRKAHSVEIDPNVLRTWAREQGMAVGERGRISVEIRNAYLGIEPEPKADAEPAEPVAADAE